MNKLTTITIVLLIFAAGCKQEACVYPSEEGSNIVASVEGEPITAGELAEAAKAEMKRIKRSAYRAKSRVLNKIIGQKLIEVAAKREGMSVEEYEKKMIDDKVSKPTQKEIKAAYNEGKRAGRFIKPFDEVKDDLAKDLNRRKRSPIEMNLVMKLRNQGDVKIMLDAPQEEVEVKGWPSVGPDDAPITIIGFLDYYDGISQQTSNTIWELFDMYKGKIKYVFGDFPSSFYMDEKAFHRRNDLTIRDDVLKPYQAAHCAGDQDKFFEYNKILFGYRNEPSIDNLKREAKELGLNMRKFNRCLASGKHAARVKQSFMAGEKAGVAGTPALIINGIVVRGYHPLRHYKEIIEGELERKNP